MYIHAPSSQAGLQAVIAGARLMAAAARHHRPADPNRLDQSTNEREDAVYVVFNTETGWSDESMRFATRDEAHEFIDAQAEPWLYAYRVED